MVFLQLKYLNEFNFYDPFSEFFGKRVITCEKIVCPPVRETVTVFGMAASTRERPNH